MIKTEKQDNEFEKKNKNLINNSQIIYEYIFNNKKNNIKIF